MKLLIDGLHKKILQLNTVLQTGSCWLKFLMEGVKGGVAEEDDFHYQDKYFWKSFWSIWTIKILLLK